MIKKYNLFLLEYCLDLPLQPFKDIHPHLSGASDWTSVCMSFVALASNSSGPSIISASKLAVAGTGFGRLVTRQETEERLSAGCRKASSFWALLSVRTIWLAQVRSLGSAVELLELFTSLTDTDSPPGSKVYWENKEIGCIINFITKCTIQEHAVTSVSLYTCVK